MQKLMSLLLGWVLKLLAFLFGWIGKLIVAELRKPLEEIKTTQKEQGEEIKALRKEQYDMKEKITEKMERLHATDPVVEECDLASLDNQICTLIAKCRDKGFTTADERRRCDRMHQAYRGRGGNHGEELEYTNVFCRLLTEEEFLRMKGE